MINYFVLFLSLLSQSGAASKVQLKGVICNDSQSQLVRVGLGRVTILSFPVPPKDIIPGEQTFDFKQVKNDLAIKALKGSAQTNIVIYLQERRCLFNLITVPGRGDDVLIIHDRSDSRIDPQSIQLL